MKKIIAIDLDGVLNTYNGKYDEDFIPLARNGASEFLAKLAQNYDIDIFTVRNKELVYKWLEENNMKQFIKNVTDIKNPKTTIFIDDRALNFCGNYQDTMNQIEKFSPYWKRI